MCPDQLKSETKPNSFEWSASLRAVPGRSNVQHSRWLRSKDGSRPLVTFPSTSGTLHNFGTGTVASTSAIDITDSENAPLEPVDGKKRPRVGIKSGSSVSGLSDSTTLSGQTPCLSSIGLAGAIERSDQE